MIFRQGDVMLVSVSEVPAGRSLKREGGKLILARGEVTGHHHAVLERNAELIESAEAVYLRIMDSPVQLTHQEHATIEVPPGTYKVIRQREYQPKELPRRVAD